MRLLFCPLPLIATGLVGCCGSAEFTRPQSTGEPWDTTYLLDVDPSTANLEAAAQAAEGLLRSATVDGVVWARIRSRDDLNEPDLFVGGDSLLFSGVATASWAWKYGTTHDTADRDMLIDHLRGLRLLTSATGSPGVLCRQVLPLDKAAAFAWPWPHREPFVGTRDGYGYYTRATRDQLTGLVLGLAAALTVLNRDQDSFALAGRDVIHIVTQDVYNKLVKDDWLIRDQNGKNDTNADSVDGLLRLGLEAVLALSSNDASAKRDVCSRIEADLDSATGSIEGWFNRFNNADQYYAHNLRAMRILTISLLSSGLGGGAQLKSDLRDYANTTWWRYVESHRSAWFDATWMSIGGGSRTLQIDRSLRLLSFTKSRAWSSPYAGQSQVPGYISSLFNCTEGYVVDPHLREPSGGSYFLWERDPWDVGNEGRGGLGEDVGLSFFAPFWLWRWSECNVR